MSRVQYIYLDTHILAWGKCMSQKPYFTLLFKPLLERVRVIFSGLHFIIKNCLQQYL